MNTMDAPNPSVSPTFATSTPLHVGAIGLNVRDLDRVLAWYREVIGLAVLERRNGVARLGAGGLPLVELRQRDDLDSDDPHSAGLYHTAFLMPTRADLARWVLHIAQHRVPISGASDHGVSEAFYLDDPEGNGVEVYSDRPPQAWDWRAGMVSMKTERLDVERILTETGERGSFSGAPDGLRIGHIHLRVGDIERGERFYRDAVGLDVTRRREGASFMSSGGYHHHVALNVWQSAGAAARDPRRAGLAWFTLEARDQAAWDGVQQRLAAAGTNVTPQEGGFEAADPWGTRVRLTRAN
jgi:catechol 2,3-dioxygenase